jgi:diphthamide synthase (EF-2-diphthine--ammonia ligase)
MESSANERFDAKFIGLGFKTIVVCVNERFLDKSFVGRVIVKLLSMIYENVDVCGENGEFHTLLLMAHFKPITLKLAKWFTGSTNQKKEDSQILLATGADIFDYGFGIVI